jgi:hypothetical protein
MDDLKLIAKSEEELQRQIHTVKTFSEDIHMEFGLEKCAKVTFKRGKLISSQNLVIDNFVVSTLISKLSGNPKVHYPTHFRLSAIVSSIHPPLPPISAGRLLHLQPEDVPWRSDEYSLNMRRNGKQG